MPSGLGASCGREGEEGIGELTGDRYCYEMALCSEGAILADQPRREQPAALAVKADMRSLLGPLPMATVAQLSQEVFSGEMSNSSRPVREFPFHRLTLAHEKSGPPASLSEGDLGPMQPVRQMLEPSLLCPQIQATDQALRRPVLRP